MKIEYCHIENFGKLHDYKVDFNDGINVIKQNNGWGKSTLAAFIRAMFYGLEGKGRTGVSNNERRKFKPWQGGAYGGSLKFETKGRHYIIERFFGSKDAEDTFVLRNADTNLEVSDFSANIGEELFHINSESFNKTVFISQNDCANSDASGDINSRIGNISDSIDLNRFESAEKKLKDEINRLNTTKTGLQGKLSADLSIVRGRLNQNANIEESIDTLMARIDSRKEEINRIKQENRELSLRKDRATKAAGRIALKTRYAELTEDLLLKEKAMNEEKGYFPGEVPGPDRFKEWESANRSLQSARAVSESHMLNGTEKAAYDSLCSAFKDGVPDEDTINGYMAETNRLYDLKAEDAKNTLSEEESGRYSFLKEIFNNDRNPSETVKKLNEDWSAKENADANAVMKTNDRDRDIKDLNALKKASSGRVLTVLLIGVLISLTGLLFTVVPSLNALIENVFGGFLNIIVIALGLMIFTTFVFLIVRNSKRFNEIEGEIAEKTDEINRLSEEAEEKERRVKGYLDRHNIFYEDDLKAVLFTLYTDASNYEKLSEKAEKAENFNHKDEISRLEHDIADYLKGFGLFKDSDDLKNMLTELKGKRERYIDLAKRVTEKGNAELQISKAKETLNEQLNAFSFTPMPDIDSQLLDIGKHIESFNAKESLYKDALLRKEKFESDNDMDDVNAIVDEADMISADELNSIQEDIDGRLEEAEGLLKIDANNLDSYNERFEAFLDDTEETERLNGEILSVKKKRETLVKVRDFLNTARENLTSKYIGPLQSGFDEYYEVLCGTKDEFKLDANMKLTKTEQGAQRERETLSYGYQDLCGFCMRLSMADAMYKGEKPVLILDDPFVNLDDEKLNGAKKLVESVAEKYQIIYMTCRENRI